VHDATAPLAVQEMYLVAVSSTSRT